MFKAVLFDLDGTLINTLYSLNDTINAVMDHYGFEKITMDETKKFIGYGYKVFVEKSVNKTAKLRNDSSILNNLKEYQTKYKELFKINCCNNLVIYDGILDTINKLKKDNVYIVCVTNKPYTDTLNVLDKAFGLNTFDYIIGDDGIKPLKPNPILLDEICKHLNIKPNECIHIGDSKTDIEFANNSKIKSIGCAYGFRDKDELKKYNATYIVDSARKLYEKIKEASI
ncbi:MAG: HAD family hydrolase [Acholeplasmatales bacterium]|nr:HAD family hydrolase [Acholeplasmatales bacterium]